MDTVTQIILGAAVGQAVGYKKLGGKAVMLGALGGLIPDLDVLYTPFLGDLGTWKYHRHITHSLIITPLMGMAMGWAAWRWWSKPGMPLKTFMAVCVLALFTHPLLDLFTIYGTQLLAPFSNKRFEIPGISIIDPVYTLPLLAGLVSLMFKRVRVHAQNIAIILLTVTTLYLFFGWAQNIRAEEIAVKQLAEQNIPAEQVKVYTTIFQPFLRRIVVREPDHAIRVGFVSTFAPQKIIWTCGTLPHDDLINSAMDTPEGQTLSWFAGNEVTARYNADKTEIILLDARYGTPGDTIFGWWGLRFPVVTDEDGQPVLGAPEKFRGVRNADGNAIQNLFLAAYGRPNNFLPAQNVNCKS